ncbi:uncharacterized protein LOC124775105 [Schistocerca piceifrons]|uniref:uncharacterized protein LOC124775105 n=1 Tax=Schistocerca piceifrons TaxID=274613 RepID=UPI001F5E8A53|nr:uncharacterized protein LOC124775105 [Schistocerca piceifrons]XP_047105886.1 uncharacterized protein LOC124775105 [Schistocerca piceifrons]XP_047105887.1 uncharacterized protein LOC124775105 [Schistocerca piceifrons]XP_047105888.1 uncharacterized protein LOC124775105 [Schistocerca piceifrons]XP_047105889.1 uncharacterized protein LOC124775105 [Schistocerca piceifrons]
MITRHTRIFSGENPDQRHPLIRQKRRKIVEIGLKHYALLALLHLAPPPLFGREEGKYSSAGSRIYKENVYERLKVNLASLSKPRSFLHNHVVASPPSHHTHSTECIKATGDLYGLLINEIITAVKSGITSV